LTTQTDSTEVVSIIDPFQKSGMVNGVDFYNGGGVAERVSNQITFNSNTYGGFSGRVGYQFGETTGSNSANRGYGFAIGLCEWSFGGSIWLSKPKSNPNSSGVVVPGGVDANVRDALLGATYDFGAFKLHGAYGQRRLTPARNWRCCCAYGRSNNP